MTDDVDDARESWLLFRSLDYIEAEPDAPYGEVHAAMCFVTGPLARREVHVIQWRGSGGALSVCGFPGTYDEQWLYDWRGDAIEAMQRWDGAGEPSGWWRHPSSGRRRPNGDPALEYVQW